MVMIDVGSAKMAREMLCAIQTQIDITQMPSGKYHSSMIQSMIDQLDIHRPLGVDGKHGDLHTLTCGCDIQSRIGVYGLCEQIDKHEAHIVATGVVDVHDVVILQSCPGQYSNCRNCQDGYCMACIRREPHDECVKDCPMCC